LLIAALLFQVRNLKKRYPLAGRITSGLIQSLFGLLFGGIGCVLVFGMFFMNNDYFQQNSNLLFLNPLLLFIVPLGILAALNKARRFNPERCLRIFWTCIFIICSITVLIRLLPFFFQQNLSVQGIVLPIAFVFSSIPENIKRLKSPFGIK
jgi:cytochrome bd-type quinol oxidase subunit 2